MYSKIFNFSYKYSIDDLQQNSLEIQKTKVWQPCWCHKQKKLMMFFCWSSTNMAAVTSDYSVQVINTRPLNSHDFVVWHTILSLISRSHAKLLFSHDLCFDVHLVTTVVREDHVLSCQISIKHCLSDCRGIKHIFFGFYARWRLFHSFEFWSLLPYPQKCRESSLKMQEIAFQRPQISKFSGQEHGRRTP